MANPSIGELFKDKRVVIGSAVVGLGLAAGAVFLVMGNNGGTAADSAAVPPAATTAAPVGDPGSPVPPAAPGGTGSIRAQQQASAGTKPSVPGAPPKAASSFANAPTGYVWGGGAAAGGTTPAPAGGAVDTAAAKVALAPIRPNVKAAGFRPDPFESYRILKVDRPYAYNFIAPLRLASRSQPKVKPPTGDPTIDFGPLPFVPRRVAGVLYNGQVSAILETGTPGDTATVEIIQPGASVTSGVPGIPNLTVAAISPTQVTLRAEDGRTVSVPLTSVPAAYESAFRASVGSAPGSDPNAGGGAPPPPANVIGKGPRGGGASPGF